MEEHKGILHKVSRMYVDNPQDREDLQQEIIVQLWKSYSKYKGEAAFSTWMYRVAINTAITYFKKDKRRSDRYTYDTASEPEHEQYDTEKERQLELFYLAVQNLNRIEKALIFYFMEGLSHRDTGIQLGISEGNVRVKLNRTKEKLQNIIKEIDHES
ncbi:RNA polymerase sigma factor [Sphingobacterium faecale]|uniref:RNA polymerase sigma factor n=1 Tax=Sphingobacterium faecale TaxID=2803775 RepID=A0ABS1R6L8_9SPHI|nr:RNA polymerase sigma factor [Sphingobacterium faecale]MBL1409511.1 RNA polymerase sigma factor [Sphingobacterium faecale]